jgi:hypothetical protein
VQRSQSGSFSERYETVKTDCEGMNSIWKGVVFEDLVIVIKALGYVRIRSIQRDNDIVIV